jgi:membrane-associated phospholipid phosphatase
MKSWIKQYYFNLTPVDVIVGAHCTIMICLIALRSRHAPETAIQYMLKYAAVLLTATVAAPAIDRVQHPLIRNPIIRFFRYMYPMFLLGPFFQWTYPISRMFFATPFNMYLLQADIAIFGFNIAQDLVHRWGDNYWLTEWFNFSYLSYYWVTLYLPLYLYFKKQYREFFYVTFIAGMTIFSCFIFQAVFPAQGPVHYESALSGYLAAGPVSEFAQYFLKLVDIPGGAMPSGHIAGTIAIFIFAWRFARKAFWFTSPVVVSLCIATVFCRYHYAVDGIVGIIVALVGVYFIGPRLYSRLFPHMVKEGDQQYDEATVPA